MGKVLFSHSQQLLNEIACALTDHMAEECGSGHFVDLTTGDMTFIQSEYMLDAIAPIELAKYKDWELECIKEYMEHELIRIECVPSYESFHVMENFAESRPEREQRSLYVSLAKRHPFGEFRVKVERMGLLQEWYNFKNAAEEKMAADWLKVNDLEIKNGKIVRRENAIKLNPSFESLFDRRCLDTDCNRIANNINTVIINLVEAYKAGSREIAIRQLLQLVLANCNHFMSEEHWCYFDDMYDPEYCYDGMLMLIANDMKRGELSEELSTLLDEGLEQISETDCVNEYGYLDLQSHFDNILNRCNS